VSGAASGMRVCVYGAGAVGGHIAGRLAKAGADVSVVARGPHLAAIQNNGLTVRVRDGEIRARIRATDDPATLGPQDAVIVTAKGPALPSVAAGIGPLLDAGTPVVFAMNGVPWWYFHAHGGPLDGRPLDLLDPGGALRDAIGMQRVLGGVVYSGCIVVEPGVVQVSDTLDFLIVGEPDGSESQRVAAVAGAINAGGLRTEISTDIRTAIWTKLLINLATGPFAVLTKSPSSGYYAEPAIIDAARRIHAEGIAVARALGCEPQVDTEGSIKRGKQSNHRPSPLQDLEAGRPLEIDGIYGGFQEVARLAGVATPTLDLLVALTKVRARAAGLYAG
jgi:2-dehydropantoate 2-reductase